MQTPENDTPKRFEWTLSKDCTKSIFLKKKMEEFSDIKMVNGFIDNKLGITYQGNCKYSHIRYKTELAQMEDYKKTYNIKGKYFSTAYISSKHKWGRIIPVNYLSLSIMRRQTRHSLCDGIYADIDMVNAQPSVLYAIAKQNDLDLPNLKLYVDDPKKFRAIISEHHECDKDVAKSLPITLMMGGSYDGWVKENDIQANRENNEKIKFINDLETEMNIATTLVYCHNKHIEKDVLRQEPNKWLTETECKRGVMGLWSQTVEKIFQECAINYLVNEKGFRLEHIVSCQDGFMIVKDLFYEDIAKDCNDIIFKTYGIGIKFILKPFDEKIEIPTFEGGKTAFEWNDLLSATELNRRLLEEYGDYIIRYKQKLFVFYENRWYDETDTKRRFKLVRYICENLYNLLAKDINADIGLEDKERKSLLTTLRVNTSARSRIADIVEKTLAYCKERYEDFNTNPFLLGFENGVYDLNENIFRNYKYDDYMTMSVKYNYEKPNYDDENVQKQWDEIFALIESIHPDKDYRMTYLQILASGLDGIMYEKLFMFNGEGGNGKGVTSRLMQAVLGDYYLSPNNGILNEAQKANSPSPDLMDLKNKRYLDFTEVGGYMNNAILNKLTGSDSITARYLQQDTEQFKLTATVIANFNQAFELTDAIDQAIRRRLEDIGFFNNFVQKGDPRIGTTIGEITYREADTKFQTGAFIQKSKMIFLDILLRAYQEFRDKDGEKGIIFTVNEKINKRTALFLTKQDLFKKIFDKIWVKAPIDTKEDTTLKLKDMWKHIITSEHYKVLSYREKRKYGRDEFYKWISTITKIDEKREKTITGYEYNSEETITIDHSQIIIDGNDLNK